MGSLQVDATPELAIIVDELRYASKGSNPAPSKPQSYKSRIEIISKAKQIMNTLHEIMAIRTLLSLRVFAGFLDKVSISLEALSRATGVQDSLLVSHFDNTPVLVDVGDGTGKIIKEIMRANPELAKYPEKKVL
ncbi:hypothetical protein MMC08_005265 [Hypocenomyce scalaris]|nr:hypothetical protein [Hypocenomyce scalaris]